MSNDFCIAGVEFNHTSNTNNIVRDILPGGWDSIRGASGRMALLRLRHLRLQLEDRRETWLSMQPSNGWGSWETLYSLVNQMIVACIEHPEEEWEITR